MSDSSSSSSNSSGVSFSDEAQSSGIQFFQRVYGMLDEELQDTAKSKKKMIDRNREMAEETLMRDYFVTNPKFNEEIFRERFRLSRDLFLNIVEDIKADERFVWFHERIDARGKKSFTTIQKCTSAIRQLASGNVPDEYDDYLAMSERTSRESLEYFCNAIIMLYGKEYLRRPTRQDIERLYNAHQNRWGIPGMIGSLDCTHVVWRSCPTALRGQYMRGDHQYPTIMLEAVVSHDLWFWHAFCGAAGSNNDINVLNQSPIFNNEINGTAPRCPFVVNGREYKRGYLLVDGIYPAWSVFLKTIPYPVDPKEKKWAQVQESARKDVERGFGVLKAKWGILNRPQRSVKRNKIRNVIYACIILHNMIIKHDGYAISPDYVLDPPVEEVVDDNVILELRDQQMHYRLRFDMVEHVATLPDWDVSDDD